jgi:hypothetical protein
MTDDYLLCYVMVFFAHMGGRIISGFDHHHHLRQFTIARYDMYFSFLFFFWTWLLDGCVHLVMQRPGILLD